LSRRISKLRTETPDRQPILIVGAIVLGLVGGLIAIPRVFSGIDNRAESYVLLASTLYQQGESPIMLRDRLIGVGIAQPASTVLSVAQRYAGSKDRKQQHQAEMLEAFGKVLLSPDVAQGARSAGEMTAGPAPTAAVGLNASALPPTPPAAPAAAAASPTTARAGVGGVQMTSSPTALVPSAAPTSAPAPTNTPAAVQKGRTNGSARLRKDPSQDGGTLATIPNAAQVEILETVRGQAIEGETRWLRVRYGNLTGYLWSKLVVVGE
jgi:hypothetical protein